MAVFDQWLRGNGFSVGGYVVNGDVTSASLLSVTQSIATFTALLPSLGEVRKTTGDPDVINDVRMGEIAASALVISVGLIASSMVKSPIPATAAIVSAAVLVAMYESVLQATPKEKMV